MTWALVLLACAPPRPASGDTATIRIAAINDFHGALYESALPGDDARAIGGLPWLVAAVEALREDHPELVVLDGGDQFQGSWPVNQSQGIGAVQAMNLLGLDAAALGNHEFDYGGTPGRHPLRGALEHAAEMARYPFLSANIRESSGARYAPEGVAPWTLIERKGRRIAVIGLTTTDTPQTTVPRHVADLRFTDPVAEVRALLPEIRSAEPDAVILVGHLTGACEPAGYIEPGTPCEPGGEIGALLTELEPGTFDVMVLGHAHTLLAHRVRGTLLMENRAHGHVIGQVELVFDRGGLDRERSRVLSPWALVHEPVDPGCADAPFPAAPRQVGGRELTPSAPALALIESLEATAGSLCDEVGCASAPLERAYDRGSPLGNWLTDAMRAEFPDAHLAIQNSGGIRASLPAGPVRRTHFQAVMPFDNRALVVELTGKQVRTLLRIGSSGAHGVLQISGGTYHFDPDRTGGTDLDDDGAIASWETDRLCDVYIADEPLRDDAVYRVVTSDFLYGGGDHLAPAFAGAQVIAAGRTLREVFTSHATQATSCIDAAPSVGAERIRRGPCEEPKLGSPRHGDAGSPQNQ